MPEKTSQVANLTRSAIAPEISATVMIAKVTWKPTARWRGTLRAADDIQRLTVGVRGRHQLLEAEELERIAEDAQDIVVAGRR